VKQIKIKIALLYLCLIGVCGAFLAEKYHERFQSLRLKKDLNACADAFFNIQKKAGSILKNSADGANFRKDGYRFSKQIPDECKEFFDDFSAVQTEEPPSSPTVRLCLESGKPFLIYSYTGGGDGIAFNIQGTLSCENLKEKISSAVSLKESLDIVCLKKRADTRYFDTIDTTLKDRFEKPIVDNLHAVNSLKALLTRECNTFYRHLFERFCYVMNLPLADDANGGLLQIMLSYDSSRIGGVARIADVIVYILLALAAILLINLALTWKEFGMKLARRFVIIFIAATIVPILVVRFARIARTDRGAELIGNVTEVNIRLGMMLNEYLAALEELAQGGNPSDEIAAFRDKIYKSRRQKSDMDSGQKSDNSAIYLREGALFMESRKDERGREQIVIGMPLDAELAFQMRRHKTADFAVLIGEKEYINTSKDADIPFALDAEEAASARDLESFVIYRKSKRGLPYSICYSRLYGYVGDEIGGKKPIGWLACALNRAAYLYYNKLEDNDVVVSVILLIMIAFTAGWFLARDMIGPLSEMIKAAGAVESGNFNVTMDVRAKDEFVDLVNSFNRMTRGLRERELLRDAFRMYVNPQLAEEIIRLGRVDAMAKGEKCMATVLFADIRNFTPFAEGHSPAEVVQLLNTYFAAIVDIIAKYEGRLDKFIGDCAMAVFGDIVKHEDDALRAICAAIEIREAVAKINAEREGAGLPGVRFGIGINTGEMIAGNIGSTLRSDLSVIGDAVNLASRLEGFAGADEIIISQATYEKVEAHVIVENPSQIFVKGKSDPQTAYNLAGLKSDSPLQKGAANA